MQLYRKVRKVELLFAGLAKEINKFSAKSGLHCLPGCGLCCFKPDIEATVLEFLPMAYRLFMDNKAEEMYEKLSQNSDRSMCMLLVPLTTENRTGMCDRYNERGLICRLFGYSAMIGKNHKPVLVTCKTIKDNQAEQYRMVSERIAAGSDVPVISNYYQQLRNIDSSLGTAFYPINVSMKKSIEVVLSYYSYRKRPRRKSA
ncbi:MAG: YkgJ family cysteine cluster protein [Bacteroidota bacterium]